MSRLEDLLYKKNKIEKKQEKSRKFVQEFPENAYFLNEQATLTYKSDFFLHNQSIYIHKVNRFASYPASNRDFFELDFMYKGSCVQLIDGKRVTLEKNDCLLLNANATRTIEELSESDILITIYFLGKEIRTNFFKAIQGPGEFLHRFFKMAPLGKQHLNFIEFKQIKDQSVKELLSILFEDYFFQKEFSTLIFTDYLNIVMVHLLRISEMQSLSYSVEENSDELLKAILKEIELNADSVTLERLAKKLNYNKNYLSNFIKKKTGQNLTKLLNDQKVKHANFLLINTSLTIQKIIETVGYSNRSYFYKKYEEIYHELPTETRNSRSFYHDLPVDSERHNI